MASRKDKAALAPGETPVAGLHVRKIGGHKCALGLPWKALRHTDPTMRKEEATEFANSGEAMFGAVLENARGRTMIGLLPVASKLSASAAVSGAAWLAASVDQRTWLAYSMGQGLWWLARVRPGEVEPGGDLVMLEEDFGQALDEALNEAHHDDAGVLPRLVVIGGPLPESHQVSSGSITVVEGKEKALFTPAGFKAAKFVRLRGLSPVYLWVALSIVLAGLLAFGGWYLKKQHDEKVLLERMQQEARARDAQAAQMASLREARITEAVNQSLTKDTATPDPSDLVMNGLRGVYAINPFGAGWHLDTLGISNGAVASNWSIGADSMGDNATLIGYAKDLDTVAAIDETSMHATFSVPVTPVEERHGLVLSSLPSIDEVTLHFGTWMQRLQVAYPDVRVTVSKPNEKAITFIDPEKPDKPTPVPAGRGYRVGQVTFQGESLASLTSLTPTFPFLTLQGVTLTTKGGNGDYSWSASAQYVVR